MFSRISKSILLFSLMGVSVLSNFKIFAQEPEEIGECQTREECENLLKEYEAKIADYEKDISETKVQSKTLKNKIAVLKKEIEKLNLQIRQSNAIIKELGIEITETESSILKTTLEIENYKKNLAVILRTIYKEDQKSYLEVIFAGDKLSDFFNHLSQLESLNLKNQEILGNIETSKALLENQNKYLAEDKDDLERMVKIQLLQKKENEDTKTENDEFFQLNEAQYQKYLKEKEAAGKKAAEIRARIFELIGVAKAPTLGEAYEIAKYVESITDVKPALVLAVLKQESNIGRNVGQCVLTNSATGAGKRISTGAAEIKVMSPSRDIPPFLKITGDLGKDPYNTPISCRMPSVGGYGGAMGPAQFIPDTWANPKYGYGLKVTEITGKPADPWSVKDAFLAAGLYLRDLGASKDEFKAVMRYFSGNSWSKYEEFYGRSVLSLKAGYEEDIKEIEAGSD